MRRSVPGLGPVRAHAALLHAHHGHLLLRERADRVRDLVAELGAHALAEGIGHPLAESLVDALADLLREARRILDALLAGRRADRLDDALAEGETAFKLMPNEAKAKLLVADAYAKKGEIDLALEAYQKASGLDPLDPAPLVNATYACLAANRLTSAKAFGQRAVLDFPGHAGAWIAQGDALSADGNPKAAKTAYESARKIAGADVALIDSKLAKLK